MRVVESVALDQPSILVSAADDAGADLSGAVFGVDGELAARAVDGLELALDPGEHRVRVRWAGQVRDRVVLLRIGEKRRRVEIAFAKAAPDPDGGAPISRSVVAPAIATGAGLALLAAGAYLNLTTDDRARELDRSCAPRCSPDSVSSLKTGYGLTVALYVGAGAAMVAGVTLFVLRTRSSSARATAGLGTVSLEARF